MMEIVNNIICIYINMYKKNKLLFKNKIRFVKFYVKNKGKLKNKNIEIKNYLILLI